MEVHAFVEEGLGHSSYLVDLGDAGRNRDPCDRARWWATHHPGDLEAQLRSGGVVVDAPPIHDFAAAHVPGATTVELGAIPGADITPGSVTVMCGHGEGAMTAASLLAVRGHLVEVLDGGPDSWSAATGRPLADS